MEYIFHERQEGSLCAQHCLNALLQGSYFTAVDLADLARQLDESERQQMAEAGTHSHEYQQFLQQPSSNFDDSGYFSLQVLQTALRVWNLDLLPYNSSDAIAISAQQNPTQQAGFICNFRDHWLAIRKLGAQWFNLNSLLTAPELISDTYLAMFITQLQQEGYSIFVVVGVLPDCEANKLLMVIRAVQPIKPALISDDESKSTTAATDATEAGAAAAFAEADLKAALERSREQAEEDELQSALLASMRGADASDMYAAASQGAADQGAAGQGAASGSVSSGSKGDTTPLEVRQRRETFLKRIEGSSSTQQTAAQAESGQQLAPDLSEEEMLQAAISLSMQMSD